MTPTLPGAPIGHSASASWPAAIALAVLVALFAAGLAFGVIRLNPDRARRGATRSVLALDAALAPRGRQDALEYLIENQHQIVMEQHDDGEAKSGAPPVLFEYPNEQNGEHAEAS